MRIASVRGRAALINDDRFIDIATASSDQFGPDIFGLYETWDHFRDWASGQPASGEPFAAGDLDCPVPMPRQVFALAVNYEDHAKEAAVQAPEYPLVFTKFPTSISGPYDRVELPTNRADWEVELVVVVGRGGHKISTEDAWDHVAGLTVGQDISERRMQFRPPYPHLSIAKSLPGFGPIGPVVVTPDEFADPDNLRLTCSVNGEVMQDGTTSDLIFPVAELISDISQVVRLTAGDLIFTGTPSGTGSTRDPRRYLQVGDIIESSVEGIGTMRNECVEASA